MAKKINNNGPHSPYVVVLGGKKRESPHPQPDAPIRLTSVISQRPRTMVGDVTQLLSRHKEIKEEACNHSAYVEQTHSENIKTESVQASTEEPKSPAVKRITDLMDKVNLSHLPMRVRLLKRSTLYATGGVLASTLLIGYLFTSIDLKPTPRSNQAVISQGVETLTAHVGRLVILPAGETPVVVTATKDDVTRLKLTDAKVGDKLLIYVKAGKIVVYNAEDDKVIGVVNRETE